MAVWVLLIIVIVLATVAYLYFKHTNSTYNVPSSGSSIYQQLPSSNVPPTSSVPVDTIKDYVFSTMVPSNLVAVKLSHDSVQIESPWGNEASYKGGAADTLGQYTFDNGIKLTVGVDKLSPQGDLKEMNLSPSDQAQYDSVFQFIASKIGQNFSSYDYERFLNETTQQSVDLATTPEDKTGYSEVLILKNVISYSPTDTLFQFINQNGKGFIWMLPDATIPSMIQFWGPNGWRYDFMIPKENITAEQVDAMIQSIKSL